MLDELDKLGAKISKAKRKEEAAKVANARAKMGVSSNQRGIKEILAMREGGSPVSVAQLACGDIPKSKSEGGRCVAAQTGSKSNIVNVSSLATDPVSEAQLASGDMIKARGDGGRCVTAQTGSVSNIINKTYQKNKNALVQSIYGGHPDGEKRTLSQITLSEGWKNQNPEEENVICGPDGQIVRLCVSVPSLVPEQVSVAQLTVGDITKSRLDGERCVHAQTGSKSNTVLKLTSAPMSEAQPAGGGIYEYEVEGG